MNTALRALACLALLAAALVPRAARAAESFDACANFVTTLPATINTPGIWCLTQNLTTTMTSGDAITVNSDDVTLDCNGFKIDDVGGGAFTTANGVRAESRERLTIRNCMIRGFYLGTYIYDLSGQDDGHHRIEDSYFVANRSVGIYVGGNGTVVQRNAVLVTVSPTDGHDAYGIQTFGTVDVVDNLVSNVEAANATVAGIVTSLNQGGSVRGNRIRGVRRTSGTGIFLGGIRNDANSGRMILRGNSIVGDGAAGSVAIECDDVTDRTKNNVIKGFATAVAGCSNDGNVIKP